MPPLDPDVDDLAPADPTRTPANALDASAINVRRSKAGKAKKLKPLADLYESAVAADVQEQL